MTSGKRLGVGVLGAHAWAEKAHLPGYHAYDRAELVAICDTVPERAQAMAEMFGIRKIYTDAQALIDDPEVQMVDVCTPTDTHLPLSLAAIRAGKHVISEKPLAHDAADAHPEGTVSKKAQRNIVAHTGLQQQVTYVGPQHMRNGQPALHVEGGPLRAKVELTIGPGDIALAGPVIGRQAHGEHAASAEVSISQLVALGTVGGEDSIRHVPNQAVGGVEQLMAVEISGANGQVQAVHRLGEVA